ncbi:hypothetical protein AB835_11580 [Candidatus Endobugula sertula]|uniref:Uncharacterized protein n=1 Tax=Candidatus Endobugula sertula TaxID=62101 RepID=A0A1D2QN08_9GAMM|nr:hypothetical protein AB835_11580 [Candidatus Endobugula sertula]
MAYENAMDKPRPVDYYQNILQLRTNPETAVAHLMNESQLMPIKTSGEIQAMEALIQKEEAAKKEKTDKLKQQYTQHAMDVVEQSMPEGCPGQSETQSALQNATQATSDESEYVVPSIPNVVLASGDFDLTPLLASSQKIKEKVEQDVQQQQERLNALANSYKEKYQQEKMVEEESLESVKNRIIHPVYVIAEDLKEQQGKKNGLTMTLNNLPNEAKQQLEAQEDYDADALTAAYDELLIMQRQARQASPTVTNKRNVSHIIQQQVRSWIMELLAQGESLAGRDFSGMDLSGMELSNLDLRDIMLENSNLAHCNFSGSNMDGAVLTEACLEQACFEGVSFYKANLSHSYGEACHFKHAKFNNTMMIEAKLTDGCFDYIDSDSMLANDIDVSRSTFCNAVVENAQWVKANLSNTQWHYASVKSCILLQATLTESVWVYANIQRTMLVDVNAQKVRFTNATLSYVQFSNVGDLQYADFAYAKCTVCGFRGVSLNYLLAPYAVFIECDFSEAQLNHADFTEALFKRTMMTLAQMENSQCCGALFNEGIVRKVNFDHSNIQKSEFYNCTLAENSFKKAKTRHITLRPQTSLS